MPDALCIARRNFRPSLRHGALIVVLTGLAHVHSASAQTSSGGPPPRSSPPRFSAASQSSGTASPAEQPGAPALLGSLESTESLEMFNPREVQLSWQNRHWLLLSQGRVLKNFGNHYEDARQAQRLIQELGLNQHGLIGSPAPCMEYWLVDGHAPAGLPHGGLRMLPLEADKLRVEAVQGQWCIRDSGRILFNFATQEEAARQALVVMKKHRFSQVGFVGQVMPSMMIFLGQGDGGNPTLPTTHGSGAAGRQTKVERFSRLAKTTDGSPRFEPKNAAASTSGYEGLVRPLIPPLAAPLEAHPAPSGSRTTLANQRAVAWHTQCQFADQKATHVGDSGQVRFDWRQAQIRQEQGAWRLTTGNQVLADFGPNLTQAQLALSAVRYYRFSEQNTAGPESAPQAYFLAPAVAPRGVMFGLKAEEIKPEKLEVQQQASGYAICQGGRVVLQFRERAEPARQALQTIQSQHLDRICRLGDANREGITFLVRSK